MSKTIIITGIKGFLGSNLAERLSKNYNLIGVGRYDSIIQIKGKNIKIFSSESPLINIFNETEIIGIIHTATTYGRKGNCSASEIIKSNILLPIKLFELANKFKSQFFINTDSFFTSKEFAHNYLPEYTLSKSQVLDWFKRVRGDTTCINIKIFHMYGPNDSIDKFIPYIIKNLINNVSSLNLSSGVQRRDFIYIEDVVLAFEIVIQKIDNIINRFPEFEVGTGKSVSVKDIVLLSKNIIGSKTELRFGVLKLDECSNNEFVANTSKLEHLGWKPQWTIHKGISKIIKSYQIKAR